MSEVTEVEMYDGSDREVLPGGQVGLVCPKGRGNVLWSVCLKECTNRCKPLPMLLAIKRDYPAYKHRYSVTGLKNPPQVEYLKRNFPYFDTIKGTIWALFGTGFHSAMESQAWQLPRYGDHRMEERMEVTFDTEEFGEITIAGRYDYYDGETKTLWDFKVLKAYAAKRMKNGNWDNDYLFQMNLYRALGPPAERLMIEAVIKDYSPQVANRDKLSETESIPVPLLDPDRLADVAIEHALEHAAAQETGNPRPCTKDEIWADWKTGIPKRCTMYCAVNNHCPQFAAIMQGRGESDEEKARAYVAAERQQVTPKILQKD